MKSAEKQSGSEAEGEEDEAEGEEDDEEGEEDEAEGEDDDHVLAYACDVLTLS